MAKTIANQEEAKSNLEVAATNEIQNIDPAILRDGRFDTKILVDYPDQEARFEIIQKDLKMQILLYMEISYLQ